MLNYNFPFSSDMHISLQYIIMQVIATKSIHINTGADDRNTCKFSAW